jgi:hypothetical protein
MTRIPLEPYLLVWQAECWNCLKSIHTQSDETKRDHLLAKLVLLTLLIKAMVLLLVLAEEMYVGRSVLRSKTPCVKLSSESLVKRILLKFRYHICTILYFQLISACTSTEA